MNTGTKNTLIVYSLVALIILAAAVLPGCAGLRVKEDDIATELVVKAATAEYLRQNPGHARAIADITGVATIGISSDKIVSLDSLDQFVRAKANLDSLAPETQLMVDMLIHRVKVALVMRLAQQGVTEPKESMVQARIILEWITTTARVYAREQGK